MASDDQPTPRWEWRAFGASFSEIDAIVRKASPDARVSIETYLLSRRSDANVKIRHGLIDVKVCERVDGGLERWRPVFKRAFPLSSEAVTALFGYWNLPTPSRLRSQYGVLDLLGDLVTSHADLRSIVVTKRRRGTVIDECLVESAALSVAGRALHTIAVEAEDPERVRRVVRALGCTPSANTNYVHALKATVGMPGSASRAVEGALS